MGNKAKKHIGVAEGKDVCSQRQSCFKSKGSILSTRDRSTKRSNPATSGKTLKKPIKEDLLLLLSVHIKNKKIKKYMKLGEKKKTKTTEIQNHHTKPSGTNERSLWLPHFHRCSVSHRGNLGADTCSTTAEGNTSDLRSSPWPTDHPGPSRRADPSCSSPAEGTAPSH